MWDARLIVVVILALEFQAGGLAAATAADAKVGLLIEGVTIKDGVDRDDVVIVVDADYGADVTGTAALAAGVGVEDGAQGNKMAQKGMLRDVVGRGIEGAELVGVEAEDIADGAVLEMIQHQRRGTGGAPAADSIQPVFPEPFGGIEDYMDRFYRFFDRHYVISLLSFFSTLDYFNISMNLPRMIICERFLRPLGFSRAARSSGSLDGSSRTPTAAMASTQKPPGIPSSASARS
jgi:hypothetical protein